MRRIGILFVCLGTLVLGLPAASNAGAPDGETVWLCKPGIADNPCLDESLGGTLSTPETTPGQAPPLGYRPARSPRFDCFYVYPTQSEQASANADLSRDPELKQVAINQASQFSSHCRVFSPVYRQYTLEALRGEISDEIRDIAYEGVRNGFREFIERYSRGRGYVLIGHSQGASHLARLLAEEIDGNRKLRDRLISAIVPGSNNVYVPKGEVVGGNLQRLPACQTRDQLRCVMAWSIYQDRATTGLPSAATFGRLSSGYWVYPSPRPDPAKYEVLCVNPAELSGDGGGMKVLANLAAFAGNTGLVDPWEGFNRFYGAECRKGDDASWLDMVQVSETSPSVAGILSVISSTNGGLHTADINLVLGNLLTVIERQGERYARWRAASGRVKVLEKKLKKARKALVVATKKGAPAKKRSALRRKVRSLRSKLVRARAAAREAYGTSGGSSSA